MKKVLLFTLTGISLIAFIIFTIVVKNVDVAAIGPNGSEVGFSTLNSWYFNLEEPNFVLYSIIDDISFITIPIGGIFFTIGLVELIRRKNIFKVDGNILALGIFYVLSFASYILFQLLVINYRPVLIDGKLEPSYPSSTTVLALIIFVTAIDQILIYVKNKPLKISLIVIDLILMFLLIDGRVESRVHWTSDIIGGLILSLTLCLAYYALKEVLLDVNKKMNEKKDN